MTKEFIPYEQALALKELGFDEECIATFTDSKLMIHGKQSLDSVKGSGLHNRHLGTSGRIITAPLYQQAFRFFREKHNLCGEVYTVNMGAIDYTFQIRDLYSEDIKHNNFEAYTGGYVGTFLTYEEAESACLDKLIEIVKKQ